MWQTIVFSWYMQGNRQKSDKDQTKQFFCPSLAGVRSMDNNRFRTAGYVNSVPRIVNCNISTTWGRPRLTDWNENLHCCRSHVRNHACLVQVWKSSGILMSSVSKFTLSHWLCTCVLPQCSPTALPVMSVLCTTEEMLTCCISNEVEELDWSQKHLSAGWSARNT